MKKDNDKVVITERDPFRCNMVRDELNHKYAMYLRTSQGHLYIRQGEDTEGNVLYHRADVTTRENVTYAVVEMEGITARANDIIEEGIL